MSAEIKSKRVSCRVIIFVHISVKSVAIQCIGILHGGASLALAETVGSIAASYCVDRNSFYIVGQEINANHIRPVRTGFVYATATPLHLGKSSQVWDIKVRNEEGKLTCVSRFTVAVLKKEPRG